MLNNLSLDTMEKNMRYIVGKIIICSMLFYYKNIITS